MRTKKAPTPEQAARAAHRAAAARRMAAEAEIKRLTARREEIAARRVLDEARRLRFLRRLDGDIDRARAQLMILEADEETAAAELAARRSERGRVQ